MSEDFDDYDGLLDDDPALDYILYEEMTKEEENQHPSKGCLGVIIFLLILPCVASGVIWYVS